MWYNTNNGKNKSQLYQGDENMKWDEFYYNQHKPTMRERLETLPEELSVVTDEDILAWVRECADVDSEDD